MEPKYHGMETAPRYEAAWFLMIGGGEVLGQYQPCWCGSDCPCFLGEFNDDPICWGVFPIVKGRVTKTVYDDEPEGWRPL